MTEQVLDTRLTARIDLMISTFHLRKALNEQVFQDNDLEDGAVSQNRSTRKAIQECNLAIKKLKLLKANISKAKSSTILQLVKDYGQYSYDNLEKELDLSILSKSIKQTDY